MRKIVFVIMLIIGCYACKTNQQEPLTFAFNNSDSCSYSVDTTFFDIDSTYLRYPGSYAYYSDGQRMTFAILNKQGMKIFSSKNRKCLLHIDRSLVSDYEQLAYISDTIIVLFGKENLLHINTRSGNAVLHAKIEKPCGYYHPYTPLSVRNGKVILVSHENYLKRYIVNIYTGRVLYEYTVSKKLKQLKAKFTPAVHINNFWYNDSLIAYTAEMEEYVTLYNLFTGQICQKPFISKYQKEVIKKSEDASMDGLYTYAKFEDYYPFAFSAANQEYFVRIYKKTLPKKVNGRYTLYREREYSIAIYDTRLDYVCDIPVPSSRLFVYQFMFLKNTIYYNGFIASLDDPSRFFIIRF